MTFSKLARLNAWRKPLRTTLLVFSVAVAFLIYGLLASFSGGMQGAGNEAGGDRLVVANASSAAQALPYGHLRVLESVDGVGVASHTTRLRGYHETETNIVPISAADPNRAAAVFGGEFSLSDELVGALNESRDHLLVGRALAASQGWSVGDRISVTAFDDPRTDGSSDWPFEITGIFDGAHNTTDTYFALARYDYVNDSRIRRIDTVDQFVVTPADGVAASTLAPRIDQAFANSAAETRTRPEQQFLEAFFDQVADLSTVLTLIVGASFATILLIVTNTMVFAVRERTFEIGLLKTLGVSRKRVLGLVLGETVFVFVLGGLIGTVGAAAATFVADPAMGLVFGPNILLSAVGLTVGLGLTCGAIPAVNAMRMPIIKALQAR